MSYPTALEGLNAGDDRGGLPTLLPLAGAGLHSARSSDTVRGTAARSAGNRKKRNSRSFRYYLDPRGRQHFNFRQTIWLNRSVQMAMTPTLSLALESLAINLMSGTLGRKDSGLDASRSPLLKLARRFCVECLLNAPAGGWEISQDTVAAWLVSHGFQLRGRVFWPSPFE